MASRPTCTMAAERMRTMRLLVVVSCLVVVSVAVFSEAYWNMEGLMGMGYELWSLVAPGGKLHPAAFLEHRGHLFLESLLLIAILYLVFLPRRKPKQKETLTEKEVEELCDEWTPEPLIPEDFDADLCVKDTVVDGRVDAYVTVEGKRLLNMESTDFLGLLSKHEIQEACRGCIEKYGVGACGPRAFYGTTDVHLKLEEHISKFLGVQETIVYSFDIATLSSVLPAFANRKDVIVVDESAHYPIQSGCQLSRAQIRTFKHNDMSDLERVLIDIDQQHRAAKKPLNRRLIVVEGIYQNRGDVAPLDRIYELKCKYKYRLIVDESLSFGVLGKTGRGACEEFGLSPGQVDLVTASLSNALASVGGFCAGDHDLVGHQRLNGYGYIFSASLPPFLAAAADVALSHLEQHPDDLQLLKERARFMRDALSSIPELKAIGDSNGKDSMCPTIHLKLTQGDVNPDASRKKLRAMAQVIRRSFDIVVSVPEYSGLEWKEPSPTLKLVVTVKHSTEELTRVKEAIVKACQSCL